MFYFYKIKKNKQGELSAISVSVNGVLEGIYLYTGETRKI